VDELAALQELSDLLARRKYNIERFVRVACPARGTILASGRADLYLSLITSAIGLLVKTSPYLLPVHTFLKAARSKSRAGGRGRKGCPVSKRDAGVAVDSFAQQYRSEK
jgi:hypothetical protein